VYVYSVATRQITRLTDGPSQAYAPTWSPDGQFIVHLGADSFGTGAGYTMAGIWAARADGSEVKELYALDPRAGDELVLGWSEPHTFLAATWSVVFGLHNLRTYNLDTGESRSLWKGCFSAGEAVPGEGTVLVSVDEWHVDCSGQSQPGAYLVSTAAASPTRALAESFHHLAWQPTAKVFLGRTDAGLQTVDPASYTTSRINTDMPLDIDLEAVTYFSQQLWAWSEGEFSPTPKPGVWLAQPPAAPRQIFNQATYFPTWAADGHTLVFFSHGMYVAHAPDFAPTLVNPQLDAGPGGTVWLVEH
jgi:hypothetical protein